MREAILRLGIGRELCYVRWNACGDHRVLFCHGTPGSRLFRPPNLDLLSALDIDLVTVDRPGYGRSTPQPGRKLLDWAGDAAALADTLGWNRFAVAGISGGGPHALACGFALRERVTCVGAISSVAPYWPGALDGMLATTRIGFLLARWAPALLPLVSRAAVSQREQFLARLQRHLPACDSAVLARPEVAEVAAENAAQALSTHDAALAMGHEMVLMQRDWGFALSEVGAPAVLWHGELDRNVPVAHGRRIAATLPDCRATFIPNAGHYLVFDHWDAILASLRQPPA